MAGEHELVNLNDVSLTALSFSTTQIIANALNKKKVLPAENGLPRDWRGLTQLAGLSEPWGENPTSQLLMFWKRDTSSTLGLLVDYLGLLDRWDVLDDCYHLIREDAQKFISQLSPTSIRNEELETIIEKQILTHDDAVRLHRGEPLMTYDFLLLYADQDRDIVDEMMDKLHPSLRYCHKDDLIGGFMFEHRGVMTLIKERCRHVVVIVTQNLLKSPMNQFLIGFAQLVAIEREMRIIIPCLYEINLTLPMELNILYKLDYNRQVLRHYDFWKLLNAAVVCPQTVARPLTADEAPAVMRAPLKMRELSTSQPSLVLSQPQKESTSFMKFIQRKKRILGKENNKAHQSNPDLVSQSSADISASSCSSFPLSEKKATKTKSKIIAKIRKTLRFQSKKRVTVEV